MQKKVGSGCRNALYTRVNLPENSPSGGVNMPGTGRQDRWNGGSGCAGVNRRSPCPDCSGDAIDDGQSREEKF